ncbi:hypothetical protein [Nesterenkonia alkaliphila]|uniref:Uncharacterized protein n=1 Tax=Nesterenkonia alkaliphila TaxID=1463631 RepID=A0A7K1ULU8_9MICC|nr:hypothetical protein [Nesterenkonia alkaliphila]MVT27447.1 hypothetical protein [Nesterenkonia alkaliphila]GFZ89716.1 hypothetical protein GCM10011359_18760 [Nesterenkonia alkaliphila]
MKSFLSDRSRRRLIGLIAALALIVAVAGIGVYGLLAGPEGASRPSDSDDPAPTVADPSNEPVFEPTIPPVPTTSDPQTFAHAVAERIFTWETTTGLMPLDYSAAILEVGDPSGTEQAGLAADLSSYFPTREAWIDLRTYSTTQCLSIEDSYTPQAWAEAVDQARSGQLPAGATAVTIEGTRHRTGVWNEEPVTTKHEVAFTLFLTCPEDGNCALLRLSELDNPLR